MSTLAEPTVTSTQDAPIATARALPPSQLYRACDPRRLTFTTTAELADPPESMGQERAAEALRFGVAMRSDNYNVFALGPSGLGKESFVRELLEREASGKPTPGDWCYVHDFAHPRHPRALALPPGRGVAFRRDMERFLDDLRAALPAVFERDDYRARRRLLEEEFKKRVGGAFEEIEARAREKGIALMRTPVGVIATPGRDGEPLAPEELERLPDEQKEHYRAEIPAIQEQVQTMLAAAPRWEREYREKVRQLDREVTALTVGHLVEELKARYADIPLVVTHLAAVEQDILDNTEHLSTPEGGPDQTVAALAHLGRRHDSGPFSRYAVNVLVDRTDAKGAPVVCLDHPSHRNLLGDVEHRSEMGTLVTDFRLLKAGALHRANGGYLVLDALKLLQQPFAWEGLKRALRSRQLRIETLGEVLSLVSTASLEPEPIPLEVKVVLVGDRLVYYLLAELDPDFLELFKVAADFEDHFPRTPAGEELYARLIGRLARTHDLLPFDPGGVARVVEDASRAVADAEKLSMHLGRLTDLLREADHWARGGGRSAVTAEDVERAVEARLRRSGRLPGLIDEEIRRGTLRIETRGQAVGQVNGLSVVQLGGFMFGRPCRITARVRLGSGQVIDIEREVKLGGPLHSKGVLILAGFLGQRYAADRPLSLAASLVFEQSYGGVDGDSASTAELLALLSALAEVPVKQCLAVTGSVDQHGHIQAIGGVNEKIEGFFDACRAKGASGEEGVVIPAANVPHLMLRADVVQAVAEGRFHVYAIETVDEGLELVTGLPAGEREPGGSFPEGSLNQRVESRLGRLAERARLFARTLPEPPH